MGCSIACIFIKADMMTFRKLCVVLFLISTVFVYTMGLKLILAQSFHRYITYGVLASFLIVYFLSMNWIPKWIKYLSYGSQYTYTLYLLHFPAFLFSLSLLGKYLLNFHWYNYLFLYAGIFLIMNLVSYSVALIFEDRKFTEQCVKSLLRGILSIRLPNKIMMGKKVATMES